MREGGCLCGAVRFRVEREPSRTVVCHCTFCQRLSGSAFAVWPVFSENHVAIAGERACYVHHSDESGRWIHLFFCPRCGTRVFSRWQEDKGELALLGGTFDETGWIKVDRHVWTRSKQHWFSLPKDALTFPRSSR